MRHVGRVDDDTLPGPLRNPNAISAAKLDMFGFAPPRPVVIGGSSASLDRGGGTIATGTSAAGLTSQRLHSSFIESRRR